MTRVTDPRALAVEVLAAMGQDCGPVCAEPYAGWAKPACRVGRRAERRQGVTTPTPVSTSSADSLYWSRREHELKCWPTYFAPLFDGDKRFEVRRNDRGFQRGDKVLLREWNPEYNYGTGAYTGRQYAGIITYVLAGGDFGIESGYCVLGLADWWVE